MGRSKRGNTFGAKNGGGKLEKNRTGGKPSPGVCARGVTRVLPSTWASDVRRSVRERHTRKTITSQNQIKATKGIFLTREGDIRDSQKGARKLGPDGGFLLARIRESQTPIC